MVLQVTLNQGLPGAQGTQNPSLQGSAQEPLIRMSAFGSSDRNIYGQKSRILTGSRKNVMGPRRGEIDFFFLLKHKASLLKRETLVIFQKCLGHHIGR